MSDRRRLPLDAPIQPPPPAVTAAALMRLAAWLSPAYPVGAFAYSGGLEWAVEAGDVTNVTTLRDWIEAMLRYGASRNDALLFAAAFRASEANDIAAIHDIAEIAAAFTPSTERHLETTAQGQAFLQVTRAAWPCGALDLLDSVWDGPLAYPVVVGVTCAGHNVPLTQALPLFMQALVANTVSAGVRLIPLGQTESQTLLATLVPAIQSAADLARHATLDDLGGCTFRADLASVRHETQYTRLFRS